MTSGRDEVDVDALPFVVEDDARPLEVTGLPSAVVDDGTDDEARGCGRGEGAALPFLVRTFETIGD